MIKGKVIRKIQGFYFCYTNYSFNNIEEFEQKLLKCKLRGSLKEKNKKDNCVIGDEVLIDEENLSIEKVFERENIIFRPLISNIDYIALTFSIKDPNFDIIQFQKNLLYSHKNNLKPILILTKIDLVSKDELDNLLNLLKENFPYLKIFPLSLKDKESFKNLHDFISNKNIVISGLSGVGKSSLINQLLNSDILKIGEVSSKTKKGKNTTVDTRFFPLNSGFIIDTPGFSNVDFPKINNILEIKEYMPEIKDNYSLCKFNNCNHLSEEICEVKKQLTQLRYEFYLMFVKNFKNGG